MMNKKAIVGFLALLLVLCLVLSTIAPVFAVEIADGNLDGKIHYVALGAEDAAGTWLDGASAYPTLLTDAWKAEGKDVVLENLAMENIRAEELHVLLDDAYAGDDYTQWIGFPTGDALTALRAEYRTAVTNADVITLDIGVNSFVSFALEQIASNGTRFNAELAALMGPDDLMTFQMYKGMVVAMIQDQWDLGEQLDVQMLVDTLAYALVSFQANFDAVVNAIYALNPDVQLVVIGMSHPVDGLSVHGENVNNIFSGVVDLCNIYTATQSVNAEKYLYAYSKEALPASTSAITIEGVAGNECHINPDGHVQLTKIINDSLANGTVGAAYYDPMMANLVGGLTGTDAKTPTEATFGEYAGGKNAYYIAIGDSSSIMSSGEDAFPEMLAKKLDIDHTNLAQAGLFAADFGAILDANMDKLEEADLVTMSFSVNTISDQIFSNLKTIVTGKGTMVEPDWSLYMDEEAQAQIQSMLDDMRNDLLEGGLDSKYPNKDITYADIMVMAIEHYLFQFIAHINTYPELINTIHAANPDALVVLVGMNNPMNGFELTYDESVIPLGEYLNFVVEATNTHYLLKAMTSENVVFVDAPDVKTVREATAEEEGEELLNQIELLPFLVRSLSRLTAEYQTHADGHAYIKDQIIDALTAKVLGDVNGDGKVNNVDAMLILQYAVGVIKEDRLNLNMANVNGDSKTNNVDAMLVLQYAVGVIEKFPVE